MVEKLTFNSRATALVDIPAMSMPIARSHKTCDICGIVCYCDKTAHFRVAFYCGQPKGAFTPDAIEALRANDLHVKSMQRHDRQSCGAIAWMRRCEWRVLCGANWAFDAPFTWIMRVEKSELWWIFASRSDVITSGGRKSETTMEDKVIVVVCGYPELYIHLRTFTKTGIHFAMRLELPGRSPSHDAYSHLLCSEFHARMAWISHANEASKHKMLKRPTTRDFFASFASGVNAPSGTPVQ